MKIAHNQHGVVWRVAAMALVVGLVGAATVWGLQRLRAARGDLAAAEQALLQLPESEAKRAALQAEIAKRQLDVDRVEAFLIRKDQLADVVGEIESVGRLYQVRVSVPAVEEKVLVDEAGNPLSANGPVLEVRLKITATGKPKDLLTFLHEIEHMQRLTYLESWRLDASRETGRNQAVTLNPATQPDFSQALLLADLIVAVRHDEEGET